MERAILIPTLLLLLGLFITAVLLRRSQRAMKTCLFAMIGVPVGLLFFHVVPPLAVGAYGLVIDHGPQWMQRPASRLCDLAIDVAPLFLVFTGAVTGAFWGSRRVSRNAA